MAFYRIENNGGEILGTFAADDEQGALDALARDAGYADHAASCKATGADPDDWTSSRSAFKGGLVGLLVVEEAFDGETEERQAAAKAAAAHLDAIDWKPADGTSDEALALGECWETPKGTLSAEGQRHWNALCESAVRAEAKRRTEK